MPTCILCTDTAIDSMKNVSKNWKKYFMLIYCFLLEVSVVCVACVHAFWGNVFECRKAEYRNTKLYKEKVFLPRTSQHVSAKLTQTFHVRIQDCVTFTHEYVFPKIYKSNINNASNIGNILLLANSLWESIFFT